MKVSSLPVFAGLMILTKVNGQIPVLMVYENTYCGGTPSSVAYFPNLQCSDYYIDQCFIDGGYSTVVTCGSGTYTDFTNTVFAGAPYLFMQMFTEGSNCGFFESAIAYPLDGMCHAMPSTEFGIAVTLNADYSVTMIEATDGTCSQLDYSTSSTISGDIINNNVCIVSSMKAWSNVNTGSTTSTGTTTTVSTGTSSGISACIVAQTAVIFVAMVAQMILLI